MSVIGSLTATPNRLEIVHRTLLQAGGRGMKVAELKKALCAIPRKGAEADEGDSTTIADEVVREACTLGLVDRADDTCHLPEALRSMKKPLLEWFEERLTDLSKASSAGQDNFPLALAWLLEQDPQTPFDFDENVRNRINNEFGDKANGFELTNKTRSQQFAYWCQYLGYAWRLSTGGPQRVLPDPTIAMGRLMQRMLALGKQTRMQELITAWRPLCPVLEGGEARRRLNELRGNDPHDPKTLSATTSLALLSLRERGEIRLERVADAPAHLLLDPPSSEPVSHITLLRKVG